ncbi:hypothetical protein [Methylocystis sp.]|uniref:hypothetical protein n=1 Tax=Methylocystis sp. TaxID=1911079 RepID=UPI003D0B278C
MGTKYPHCFQAGQSFVVEDVGGVALVYVYFEGETTRRGLVNRLPGADAKAVAQTIARALTADAKA